MNTIINYGVRDHVLRLLNGIPKTVRVERTVNRKYDNGYAVAVYIFHDVERIQFTISRHPDGKPNIGEIIIQNLDSGRSTNQKYDITLHCTSALWLALSDRHEWQPVKN